ncbi:MAG TPA: sterol desaturase family protein [Fibrobacteria bacterium]|nr:sterol desaturase family protein [Fibrobacteria bacterium]
MGTANYWFAFIADFATALFFLAWDVTVKGYHPFWAATAFAAGFVIWGLTEYVFHRWVYHQAEGIFGAGHNIHHAEAQVLIAMPWFMTTLTMFGLWHFCSRVLGIPCFSSVLAGWLVGFVWYSLVHHSHHHWNLKVLWLRKLKAYHRVHHQFPGYNYGVTMRFWDVVFGTLYRKPGAPSQRLPSNRRLAVAEAAPEPVLADA